MKRLIVYRNAFTGDVSGGDIHMSGFLGWLIDTRPITQVALVSPKNDGQDGVYPEMSRIKTITHPNIRIRGSIALLYAIRAFLAATRVNRIAATGDVLVASSHFLPDVLPVALAPVTPERKTVFIHHIIQDMDRPKGLNTYLANLQERFCFSLIKSRFGKVVVVNQQVADRLRELGFHKQQILLSANFVQPTENPKRYDQKDITLAFCGRMVTQKGIDDFLDVCRQLRRGDRRFNAVMIGVGPDLERLRNRIATEKLPVNLVGYVDDATKFDFLSRAKMFVFPSAEEGWGIAVAEALAVGTPVLAYDLPVYSAVFGGHLHVVPLNDKEMLGEAARQLLRSYDRSPETYTGEQDSIAAYASQFRVEQVATKEYDFIGSDVPI
jgi:glycosyltransferase involved in cell wall biosynthesis